MKSIARFTIVFAVLILLVWSVSCKKAEDKGITERVKDFDWIEYPQANRVDQVDVYHGVEVADPYRWMEDEQSDETQAWLKGQEEISSRFYEQIPERDEALTWLKKNWLGGVGSVPIRRGENSFFMKEAEGKPHAVLYVRKGIEDEPEAVFDLNEHDTDGLRTMSGSFSASPNGHFVIYSTQYAGSDAADLHIHDVNEEKDLEEIFPPNYFGAFAWNPEETGFFYSHLDPKILLGQESEKKPGLYWHKLGTPIDEDKLVFDQPWKGSFRVALPSITDDQQHLLIHNLFVYGSRGGWAFAPLDNLNEITWIIDPKISDRFSLVGSIGSEVFFVTDYKAPNWRIVAMDLKNPGLDNLREVVAEQEMPISIMAGNNIGLVLIHEKLLYVTYIEHNAHTIKIYDTEGSPKGDVPLPFLSTVSSIQTKKGDNDLLMGLTSFLRPPSIYAYNTEAKTFTPYDEAKIPAAFANYEMNRVFYESKDGTRIPMTVIHRKGLKPDGKSKVLLYGYGGWGIPNLPSFNNYIPWWLEKGGIYALANLRGGSEYGEEWHKAGMFQNKQNVFDDFCAAADYLVKEGYTSHSRIAILGASNGGLLTAACYNQRPELFGAVVSQVAAIDLLRLPLTPIGGTQTMELGAPSQGKDMFAYLLGYSPLHNISHEGSYPPILNVVGENDPRCKPGHIYKFVAELQRMDDPNRLVILTVIKGAGHGTANKDKMMASMADWISFAWAMTE
ncbi:prolyl oligopeptidase family protein [Acidobacteriota bacterium]